MNPTRLIASLVILFLLAPAFSVAEEVRRIPVAMGLASHPVNGGDCLVSDGEYQYLAFYDDEHRMTVAKRKLGETEWEFASLPESVGWDTHNKVVIFLDRDGYVHVTGNMHNHPLKYFRTSKPGDIQTFESIGRWTGVREDRVCYPKLLQTSDGTTLMMHRYGGSGNGMRLLKRYHEDGQRWSGPGGPFISGMNQEPTCNAYPFGRIQEGPDGALHIAWCWRETPDVLTNFDVCYARSEDKGMTWTSWTGEAFDLPMTPENADVVADIPQRSGLMNGGSLAIDNEGNPYIGYTRYDDEGRSQLYVATPHEGVWRNIQITDWPHRFEFEGRGSIPASPPLPSVSSAGDGIHISYRNSRVEPGHGVIRLTHSELLSLKPGEVAFSQVESNSRGIAHLRAVNRGPLPDGESHYMQQETARPNRDRKPENPKAPTMIYLVEVKAE